MDTRRSTLLLPDSCQPIRSRVPHLTALFFITICFTSASHPEAVKRAAWPRRRAPRRRGREEHLNLKGSKFGVLSGPKKKFAVFSPYVPHRSYLHEKSALRFFRLHTRDVVCARARPPVELARILENSLRGSSATMNFSDRCDTVHVFHSHRNGRSRLVLTKCLLQRATYSIPFYFSFQIFPYALRYGDRSRPRRFFRLDDVEFPSERRSARRATNRLKFTKRTHDGESRPLINNPSRERQRSSWPTLNIGVNC